MKRYFRYSNDPKRFKPLVTAHDDSATGRYWVITSFTFKEIRLVEIKDTFEEAIEQANAWADEYRAAWVAANMKAA